MKKPKIRELKQAIKSLLSKPFTQKFPLGPAIPVPEKFRGRPVYDKDICVGCGACAQVCPVGVIEVIDDQKTATRKLHQVLDLCIYCGQCERYCITKKGIQLTKEYDLATYDRHTYKDGIEKKLALCEFCGAIVGPIDHIKWIAERVGEAAYSNPTLMLTLIQQTAKIEEKTPTPASFLRRADRIRILCHKCRKITTLEK